MSVFFLEYTSHWRSTVCNKNYELFFRPKSHFFRIHRNNYNSCFFFCWGFSILSEKILEIQKIILDTVWTIYQREILCWLEVITILLVCATTHYVFSETVILFFKGMYSLLGIEKWNSELKTRIILVLLENCPASKHTATRVKSMLQSLHQTEVEILKGSNK